jgi:hypothetical protein
MIFSRIEDRGAGLCAVLRMDLEKRISKRQNNNPKKSVTEFSFLARNLQGNSLGCNKAGPQSHIYPRPAQILLARGR